MPDRHPFASETWVEMVGTEVAAALAGVAAGQDFSFSERYVAAPPGRVGGWHVRVRDGACIFTAAPDDDADVQLIVDYEVARTTLRVDLDPTELRKLQREAVADARIRWVGDPAGLPPELATVHDRVAARTDQGD